MRRIMREYGNGGSLLVFSPLPLATIAKSGKTYPHHRLRARDTIWHMIFAFEACFVCPIVVCLVCKLISDVMLLNGSVCNHWLPLSHWYRATNCAIKRHNPVQNIGLARESRSACYLPADAVLSS